MSVSQTASAKPQLAQALRPAQAANRLGIGVSTLWRWVATRPDFPRPRRLSPKCTVFDEAELAAWRDAQAVAPGGQ